jgi:hypothetical protein
MPERHARHPTREAHMPDQPTTRERTDPKEMELKDLKEQKPTEENTDQVRGGACAGGQHIKEGTITP